jgi:hypothetical protein
LRPTDLDLGGEAAVTTRAVLETPFVNGFAAGSVYPKIKVNGMKGLDVTTHATLSA